ncbi:hypothetical protein ANO14919_051960 [Xylariales sp. No.14919]|nr:hypothetical protein ANO14919_051960 [Xylariales sp. No.14919]
MSAGTSVQPNMGSSVLQDGEEEWQVMAGLPFGYNFSEEALIRSPPSPRGNPILNPNDDSLLGNFFTDMRSDQYSMLYGEGLNFSPQWFHAAPNLLSHSTSFGQQSTRQPPTSTYGSAYHFRQDIMPLPTRQQQERQRQQQQPPPPSRPAHQPLPYQLELQQPQSQPALTHYPQNVPQFFHGQSGFHVPAEQNAQVDAATLLTTLQSGRPNGYLSRTNSLSDFRPSSDTQPQRSHGSSFSQLHPMQDYDNSIRPTRSNEVDTLFTDMMFGSQGSSAPRPAERPELQWGSDIHFAGNQTFVPAQHESSEALERRQLETVSKALKLAHSIPNTRASSPIGGREATGLGILGDTNGDIRMEENAATPKKPRKAKAKTNGKGGDHAVQSPSKAAATAKKRKSQSEHDVSPGFPAGREAPVKRRKSAPSQPKPPRENLTDAQKRENHIKSEQKRRGAIKEGFDDLNFIVPNLQNGGYSKSSTLILTGEWLDSLIRGNQNMDLKGKRVR